MPIEIERGSLQYPDTGEPGEGAYFANGPMNHRQIKDTYIILNKKGDPLVLPPETEIGVYIKQERADIGREFTTIINGEAWPDTVDVVRAFYTDPEGERHDFYISQQMIAF